MSDGSSAANPSARTGGPPQICIVAVPSTSLTVALWVSTGVDGPHPSGRVLKLGTKEKANLIQLSRRHWGCADEKRQGEITRSFGVSRRLHFLKE